MCQRSPGNLRQDPGECYHFRGVRTEKLKSRGKEDSAEPQKPTGERGLGRSVGHQQDQGDQTENEPLGTN